LKIRKAKLQPEHAALTAPPAHTARMRLLVGGAVFWGLVRTPAEARDLTAIQQAIQ